MFSVYFFENILHFSKNLSYIYIYIFKEYCNIIKMLTKKAQNLRVSIDMSGKTQTTL
jgi:hypothetical protein